MKTTEIFIEQVLIGLLVLFVVGVLALPGTVDTILGTEVDDLSTIAILIATAYVIGIVYDRVADTLLEHLERHHRLVFALQQYSEDGEPPLKPPATEADPFPEDRYRMHLFQNEAAVDQAHYIRSRMRLTRSLATLTPALAIALALYWIPTENWAGFSSGAANREWPHSIPGGWHAVSSALLVLVGYAVALVIRLLPARKLKREELYRTVLGPASRVRLPRTDDFEDGDVRTWYRRQIGYDCDRRGPSSGWLVFVPRNDPVAWILLAVSLGCTLIMLTGTDREPIAFLPLGGLALTLLFAWSWWRISRTYFTFLKDFAREYPMKQAAETAPTIVD